MKTRTDELFVHDIISCCGRLDQYLLGVSRDDFDTNLLLQDAVVRNIEVIGEASKNLSQDFKDTLAAVQWKEIGRMRDKIVHHYFRIDLEVVWQTATRDIPQLASALSGHEDVDPKIAKTGGESID